MVRVLRVLLPLAITLWLTAIVGSSVVVVAVVVVVIVVVVVVSFGVFVTVVKQFCRHWAFV